MTQKTDNTMQICFPSKSANEGFARVVVAAFVSQLDPTLEQLADIKTAVSEAVTNAIVHGYVGKETEEIRMTCMLQGRDIIITVEDKGCGIADIEQARQPMFTTNTDEERSGMGFTVMEMFMDEVEVVSAVGQGTCVTLRKHLE